MTRNAKSEDEYKEAWNWHINQIATLALQARIDYNDYMRVKSELLSWVQKAVTINNATQRTNHE